jgi:hypothetical protein
VKTVMADTIDSTAGCVLVVIIATALIGLA